MNAAQKYSYLKGQQFKVHGVYPDGGLYDHGICTVTDIWSIPKYDDSFGISIKDKNGCGWHWPGIDEVQSYPGKTELRYRGGIPVSQGVLTFEFITLRKA